MTNEESLGHFRQQQKRYVREHGGVECPHYSNAIYALGQIERLTAENAALKEVNRALRNELCLKCGRYKQAHEGACDGCRWRKGE